PAHTARACTHTNTHPCSSSLLLARHYATAAGKSSKSERGSWGLCVCVSFVFFFSLFFLSFKFSLFRHTSESHSVIAR
ncbi:hypothetical protein V8E52_008192, partial [Russula decolorans]